MDIDQAIKENTELWQTVANENNWINKDNIYVQIWFNQDGSVNDSLSTLAMTTNHYLLVDEDEEEQEYTTDIDVLKGWFN